MNKGKKSVKPRLYLDIDGVLNSKVGDKEGIKKYPKEDALLKDNLLANKDLLHKFWYEPAVKALKYILDTSRPEIYIHSTWKNHFELKDLKKFFDNWGLDSTLIKGIVPQYKFSSERYHNLSWHIQGDRINEKEDKTPVHNYVVLDDLNMTHIFEDRDVFKTRQIVCDPEIGLTMEQAKEAVALFEKNSN